MIVTKNQIDYHSAPYGKIATIPAGTPCIRANNLPQRTKYELYWVEPWQGMSEQAESWQRNYGFLVNWTEVEFTDSAIDPACECDACGYVHNPNESCIQEPDCPPDDMDGDHASALASAGMGTDEDYGGGTHDWENWDGDSDGSVGCD